MKLEETRLDGLDDLEAYPSFRERHRVFPEVFEDRGHSRILDTSAGVGCAAHRIKERYPGEVLCNDISPSCLRILRRLGLRTVSFNIDDERAAFPFPEGHFDALISLATIEHLIHINHFLSEIHRILSDEGYFYISAPNYASLVYLPRLVVSGRSFHDPLSECPISRYEFYAHVRYFTYRTLLEFVSSFGFVPDTVYLPLPEGSSRYRSLYSDSKCKALAFRWSMKLLYNLLPPRWAPEPIICFRKASNSTDGRLRKVVL